MKRNRFVPGDKRTQRVSVAMTEAEKVMVEETAVANRMTISALIIKTLRDAGVVRDTDTKTR